MTSYFEEGLFHCFWSKASQRHEIYSWKLEGLWMRANGFSHLVTHHCCVCYPSALKCLSRRESVTSLETSRIKLTTTVATRQLVESNVRCALKCNPVKPILSSKQLSFSALTAVRTKIPENEARSCVWKAPPRALVFYFTWEIGCSCVQTGPDFPLTET